MDILLSTIALALVVGLMLYHRASLMQSLLFIGITLLATTLFGVTGGTAWLVYIVVCAVSGVPAIRQSLFSAKALTFFRKVLPAMSQTEKEALDAGTVWWETELFKGKPDWRKLQSIPTPKLTAEEQAFLNGPVNEVCKMTSDFQVTHELADLPPEVWQYLKDNKFFAMIIKKKYGGLEFSAYAQSLVLQKLTGVSGVLSSTVGVPNSLGPGELLQHYGTEEQKNHYLPCLAVGKEIPCFALTRPEAGSDAGSTPDYGIVCKGEWEGKEVSIRYAPDLEQALHYPSPCGDRAGTSI
jgi:acyl-CoA dehydrogenase